MREKATEFRNNPTKAATIAARKSTIYLKSGDDSVIEFESLTAAGNYLIQRRLLDPGRI
ncbi:hypothetical protein [Parasphingorhabdus sp.]|uniref:hypothetical protein n=1 Tax=Parasphingorhabdus sp. TaxID=2709688 RepID=UPI003594863A